MDLRKTTYILVIITSVMAIAWLGKENSKPFTYECDFAKRMADSYLLKLDGIGLGREDEEEIIRKAGHYANYYEAMCD